MDNERRCQAAARMGEEASELEDALSHFVEPSRVLHHRIVRETRLEAHPLGLTFDRAHDVTCVRDQNIGRAEPRLLGPVPAMLSAFLLSDRSFAKTRDRIGAPR